MVEQKITLLADALTTSMQAGSKTVSKQLDQLKKELPAVLQTQPLSELFPGGLTSFEQFALQPAIEKITATPATSKTVGDSQIEKISGAAEFRVVRREVPAITTQFIGSTPSWAAGQAIDHTLGPFTDGQGKFTWWDFYKILQNIVVQIGANQYLMIPLRGLLTSQQLYKLSAGTVWIRSNLISPLAPSNGFTGLTIRGGTITFSAPVTISGGNIIVAGITDSFELDLDLDQPKDAPANDTSTGEDARKLTIQLPQKLMMAFNVSSGKIVGAGDMGEEVYGNSFSMAFKNAIPTYNAQLGRILVSYTGNPANPRMDITKSLSKLFQVSGQASEVTRITSSTVVIPWITFVKPFSNMVVIPSSTASF